MVDGASRLFEGNLTPRSHQDNAPTADKEPATPQVPSGNEEAAQDPASTPRKWTRNTSRARADETRARSTSPLHTTSKSSSQMRTGSSSKEGPIKKNRKVS